MLANKIYHSVSFAFCGYFLEHHWKETKIGCVASTVKFPKKRGHREITAEGMTIKKYLCAA